MSIGKLQQREGTTFWWTVKHPPNVRISVFHLRPPFQPQLFLRLLSPEVRSRHCPVESVRGERRQGQKYVIKRLCERWNSIQIFNPMNIQYQNQASDQHYIKAEDNARLERYLQQGELNIYVALENTYPSFRCCTFPPPLDCCFARAACFLAFFSLTKGSTVIFIAMKRIVHRKGRVKTIEKQARQWHVRFRLFPI